MRGSGRRLRRAFSKLFHLGSTRTHSAANSTGRRENRLTALTDDARSKSSAEKAAEVFFFFLSHASDVRAPGQEAAEMLVGHLHCEQVVEKTHLTKCDMEESALAFGPRTDKGQ